MKRLGRTIACLLLCAALTAGLTPSAAAASFRDVPSGHWAAASITRAVQAGLIQGESATTFGLGHPMTRGAFTVVLCRFFGWEPIQPAAGSFADNKNTAAWYFSAVETALAHGAVTKQTEVFRPGDPITREEMAVMLVRALGYTTIAGLDQGLACPFTDVTTNRGYLTMAYQLGISGGVAADAFAPDRPATREQAVVMLMRVYDRYQGRAAERIGVADRADGLTDLNGFSAVAISAARLSYGGTALLTPTMGAEEAQTLRENARAAGAKAVLRVSASEQALRADPTAAAQGICAAVVDGGYDGVLLDVPRLPQAQAVAHAALVTALRAALGTGTLYVTAELPLSDGTVYGYDYVSLSAAADRLILRADTAPRQVGGFPADPMEPLEEVYYGLAAVKDAVDEAKVSLWLTTTGSAFRGTAATGSVPAQEIEALLNAEDTERYYSPRYAAAYLIRTAGSSHTVVWYNDGAAAAARAQLGRFFGAGSVCLSDLTSVANYEDYSILSGLLG